MDGHADITDAVHVLSHLFQGAKQDCLDAADIDNNGKVDITDPIAFLGWLFLGALPPEPPVGACGQDLAQDDMGCDSHPVCQSRLLP